MKQDHGEREDERRAFAEYARQSQLPPLEDWDGDSLLLSSVRGKNISYTKSKKLPTDGSIVHFSSPLFVGKLLTRIRDDDQSSYFHQKSRKYNWIVQGHFIREGIGFDEVITGQEFDRPFRNAPSSKLVQHLLEMLKHKLPDSFDCDFSSDKPYFEHPLLSGCQHFRIDEAAELADVKENELHGIGPDGNVIEDTSLLGDDEIPKDGAGRRKYFSKQSNLKRYIFDTSRIYTFDFYSSYFNPRSFYLEVGPISIDTIPYFNGYPLFLSMAKIKSTGDYLWATEIWHKRLLGYHEEELPRRFALSRWF